VIGEDQNAGEREKHQPAEGERGHCGSGHASDPAAEGWSDPAGAKVEKAGPRDVKPKRELAGPAGDQERLDERIMD
jgi:hypothetical protein